MISNRTHVSPGVYTTEKDLTYITKQVGVTTLGLVGETVKGPAFQPIFVSGYDEFKSFFGGLNPKKFKDNGNPQYELPYIAKSYFTKSNQLFVTRVLGFSGYNAGKAWAITLDAAMDESTLLTNSATTISTLSYSANTGGTITSIQTTNPTINQLFINGKISLQGLSYLSSGSSYSIDTTYSKVNSTDFSGVSANLTVLSSGTIPSGFTGVTSLTASTYSAKAFTNIEDKVVVLLRSRGKYDGDENLEFEIVNSGDLTLNGSNTSPLGDFNLTGTSLTQGAFNYEISLDKTKKNYITRVLGREAQDGKASIFVEEIFENMFSDLLLAGKIRGLKTSLVAYNTEFSNYKYRYSEAITPFVLSELNGNTIKRLFRFYTISDGNSANEEFKISIANIKPTEKEFDVLVRAFYDTDDNPVILERFSRCVMDPKSASFIGRKIGTVDGEFTSNSKYILADVNTEDNTSDSFPAGFMGVPLRNYGNALAPDIEYKTAYTQFENKRKSYLGITSKVGIDQDFFDCKRIDDIDFSATTSGFHLDINANGAILNGKPAVLSVGNASFQNENSLVGTDYAKLYSRKFTFAPYGGFDGWDIYRTNRTHGDAYAIGQSKAVVGTNPSGPFKQLSLTNGELGNTSDFYAFLEAIRTFSNPESNNINVFATPGIDLRDNTNLVEQTVEMIEQERADSLYIITMPDASSGDVMTAEEAGDILNDSGIDSNYSATYWPWNQVNDTENNVLVYLPPTRDVVRNIALTDNISYPWFAIAGMSRGEIDAVKSRKKLTITERDTLYENRINPIITFASEGIKVWGNKTLQVKDTALSQISVRRLLLQTRKLISAVAIRLLFEQNDDVARDQFLKLVNPILSNIRAQRGLSDFRVEVDRSPESLDRRELNGRIHLKPTNSLEFINLEFTINPTGASFENL
jgi:hypothetical protein